MANKKTQRAFFNDIIALAEANNRADIVEFAQGRIAVLNRKSASRTPSKNQELNETLKTVIVDTLRTIGSGTVTTIQNANAELGGYSTQKITALVRQLVEAGTVIKTVEKKSSIFSLAEGA